MKIEYEGSVYTLDDFEKYSIYIRDRLKYIMYQAYRNIRDSVVPNRCHGMKLAGVKALVQTNKDKAMKYTTFSTHEIDTVISFIEKYYPNL
ncbi:hypothetical protein [Listeria booriae]|uniref:hypothetical protein n=1 Tax=Listeria booriae TaxID=1552123 RepID=UPI001624627D|nr:hypothetical protein [Listeria booriae]MBC1235210.1 hypothetical protein [Listeria booriae]